MTLEEYVASRLAAGRAESEREECVQRVRLFFHYKAGYEDYLKRNPNVKADGRYPDYEYAARMSGLFADFVRECERGYDAVRTFVQSIRKDELC